MVAELESGSLNFYYRLHFKFESISPPHCLNVYNSHLPKHGYNNRIVKDVTSWNRVLAKLRSLGVMFQSHKILSFSSALPTGRVG